MVILQSYCDDCNGKIAESTSTLTIVPLCTKACNLLKNSKILEWRNLCDEILKWMCGAFNCCPEGEKKGWCFLIHLQESESGILYLESFSEKIDDKLRNILPPGARGDVYKKKIVKLNELDVLRIRIHAHATNLSIKDGRSSEIVDRGLLESGRMDLTALCYYLYERPDIENAKLPQRPKELLESFTEGSLCKCEESAMLQIKLLRKGDKENVKSQLTTKPLVFSPKTGSDFVEWLWEVSKRTIGEYVSAFAKIQQGGIYYCGFKEKKSKNPDNLIGYEVCGLPLADKWKDEIRIHLERRIKEEMLWLERDPNERKGFKKVLPVAECHFAIEFIEVTPKELPSPESPKRRQEGSSNSVSTGSSNKRRKESKTSQGKGGATKSADHPVPESTQPSSELLAEIQQSGAAAAFQTQEVPGSTSDGRRRSSSAERNSYPLYILEVRVAPFNGVVFHHKDGIETYTLKNAEGEHGQNKFSLEEMPREMWEDKVSRYAWCSKHQQVKKLLCEKCRNSQEDPVAVGDSAH